MSSGSYDVVVVGAGPGGLSAAARAHRRGLSCLLLERSDHLADTIFKYQARKHVMAEPGKVDLRSDLEFELGTREEVLGRWQGWADQHGLPVAYGQELTKLERDGDGFNLATAAGGSYRAANVVLAVGTQGNPRTLTYDNRSQRTTGQELPHVHRRLDDPDNYYDKKIVVVGAGDSALEVANSLAPNNDVGLVVRKPSIEKAKEVLASEAEKLVSDGRMKIYYNSETKEIHPDGVVLIGPEGEIEVPAEMVFLMIGADPPARFLAACGIQLTGGGRDAKPKLTTRFEAESVPGLYVIGSTAARGDLIKLAMNQGYEVIEYILGNDIDPADEQVVAGNLPLWNGKAAERIEQLRREVPLFAAAEPAQVRKVFLYAEVDRYRDGEVIIRQNDSTDTLLVVARGRVAISVKPDGGGQERHVATLDAGEFFGEMSLISGRRRNATATAVGDTAIIEVPRKAMLELLEAAPEVKRMVDDTFLIRAFQKYLFPRTPVEELRELARMAETLQLGREEAVFEEKDPGDAFYLIRSGMVQITKRTPGGKEIIVSYLDAGNSFGETALLDGVRRTASVSTIFPSQLIRLSKRACDEFLARRPAARADLVEKLEPRRIDNLALAATPRAGEVVHDLIEHEVVMGTDALIIDNHKCVRCNNCIRACEGVHQDNQARLSLTGIEFHNILAPNSCWQCKDPKCMLDCPPDAIVRNPRGEVFIKDNCIGCGNCEKYCPYDNIFMVYPKDGGGLGGFIRRIFGAAKADSERQVAVKCDLCASIAGGPACVRSCPTGAAVRLQPHEYVARIENIVVRKGAE